MNFNLNNKKIFVTGASGGIGTALCDKFIESNSTMILTSSNQDKVNILKNKYGNDHFYYVLDFLNIEKFSEKVMDISSEHNDVDNLINNRGINSHNIFFY